MGLKIFILILFKGLECKIKNDIKLIKVAVSTILTNIQLENGISKEKGDQKTKETEKPGSRNDFL
jgi:hypothetical protein